MSASPSPRSRSVIVTRLRAAGCVYAEDEAQLLISEARTPAELDGMVDQRVAGLPLEHVLGWAEFCGLRIAVDLRGFVPRRRTEFLVHQAAGLAPPQPVVVDLCSGSGAVSAALVATLGRVELCATDIDPVAVRCARRNIAASGQVFEGDLYEPLPKTRAAIEVAHGRLQLLARVSMDFIALIRSCPTALQSAANARLSASAPDSHVFHWEHAQPRRFLGEHSGAQP